LAELRQRWLDHHEHVLRSSLATLARYRTATSHLITFLTEARRVSLASQFGARDAEAFVRWLRSIEVAPNGHPNSDKRPLMDKGIKYILETCRALFTYAGKRRHLPPYAENPFKLIEMDRLPIDDAKPICVFSHEQERQFLDACGEWELPIFLTLMLTGLRPGELCHLLVEDIDLKADLLRVRNKPKLGWQIKTRGQREVPLLPLLAKVLKRQIGPRSGGAVFRQPRCARGHCPPLDGMSLSELEAEAARRMVGWQHANRRVPSRVERSSILRGVWRDLAALKEDRLRTTFIRVARVAKIGGATAPKTLRHGFATALQEGSVDPLVRNILMGHAPAAGSAGGGLGMTAVYTHTRLATLRTQLWQALARHEEHKSVHKWIERNITCGDRCFRDVAPSAVTRWYGEIL
jgi:integrase